MEDPSMREDMFCSDCHSSDAGTVSHCHRPDSRAVTRTVHKYYCLSWRHCLTLTYGLLLAWTLSPATVILLVAAKDVKSVDASLSLQCPPCDRIHCTPRRPSKLRCKGGLTRGICNCCPVCAKTQGETCGGDWHYLGKCDQGLVCGPATDKAGLSPYELAFYQATYNNPKAGWPREGVCRRGKYTAGKPRHCDLTFTRKYTYAVQYIKL